MPSLLRCLLKDIFVSENMLAVELFYRAISLLLKPPKLLLVPSALRTFEMAGFALSKTLF